MSKQLVILRGLPGSGKTTLAKFLEEEISGAIAVCADDYFETREGYVFKVEELGNAHAYCQGKVNEMMEEAVPVIVVHNTSTTMKEMRPYLKMAEEHGYQVTSVIVENRHGNGSVHRVPTETINKMEQRFDVKL